MVSSRNRYTPRGVKRKMSGYPIRPGNAPTRRMQGPPAVNILYVNSIESSPLPLIQCMPTTCRIP